MITVSTLTTLIAGGSVAGGIGLIALVRFIVAKCKAQKVLLAEQEKAKEEAERKEQQALFDSMSVPWKRLYAAVNYISYYDMRVQLIQAHCGDSDNSHAMMESGLSPEAAKWFLDRVNSENSEANKRINTVSRILSPFVSKYVSGKK